MKISLVSTSKKGWHIDQIVNSAKELGVDIKVINIKDINNLEETIKSLGDIIIWRAASISPSIDRTILLTAIKNSKYIINHAIIQPLISYKLYQQKIIKRFTKVPCINTYKFSSVQKLKQAIENGILKYPFIQKPNLGCRGNDVTLIKSEKDINKIQEKKIKNYIYQNFIPNDGDYRVLMLGGKVLGVMQRKAKEGSFLNNISKGGTAIRLKDPEVYTKVTSIAKTVAATLDLNFCGVDIIRDIEQDKYFFLEVNTAPQWRGFQTQFPEINVAKEVIKHSMEIYKRKNVENYVLVKDYYDKNYKYLGGKKFHYASRMYLWTGEDKYKKLLYKLQKKYIGKNIIEIENKIKYYAKKLVKKKTKTLSKKIRSKYYKKYPKLKTINKILFLNLFSETIYGIDLRPIIKKYIPNEEFMMLFNELSNDKEAIAILSTHAINNFYLLENYLKEKITNPEYYVDIYKNLCIRYKEHENKLKVYLLTHCIIGASKFYKVQVNNDIYKEMCKLLEEMIIKNYFNLSLDNKLEFIVCCRLTGYKSYIEEIILSEANNSLSNVGNFIIDKLNNRARNSNNQFQMSEHRNVLYLMSNIPKKWF